MKNLLLPVLLLVSITGCNAQNNGKINFKDTAQVQQNKPDVSWKVNKKYDNQGNLVGYDSTYSWSYSSKGGIKHIVEGDSVLTAFKKQFDTEFPSFFIESFGAPIWNASVFFRDFIYPDYFTHTWEHNYFDMDKMMHRLDSLRNSFLDDNYPSLLKKLKL